MLPRRFRAAALAVLSLAACQAPDLSEGLNTFVFLSNEVEQRLCDCYQDAGFQSSAACFDALDQLTQGDIECVDAALDGHEQDGQEYLDCANAALDNYLQCVADNVGCVSGANAVCTSVYTLTVAECTQLPAKIKPDFDQCIAG